MYMFRPASIVAAALLFSTPAHAQDAMDEIDEIFSFATSEVPGCAVGASQNGRVLVNRAYGLADVERRIPLTASSVFDIGSTQKQFDAAAVLMLVEDGRLSLSDDVRKHIPELPDYGHTITLNHLLTHTSGLRDWIPVRGLSGGDPDVMTVILRQRGLNFVPGEEFSYSNTGYVLLKEIVARVSGVSFAEFARERLFEPLGMESTAFVPDILQGAGNAALGYAKAGEGWEQSMMLGNARGDGAIASTVGDLLIWNEALANVTLGTFVTEKLQEPARLNNGRIVSYARGLIVQPHRGARMVWHSGGAAGYSAWLGRLPADGLSVAVLCNFEPVSATELAHRVADQFLPIGEAYPGRSLTARAAADVDVSSRAGLFLHEQTGEPLRLIDNDGELRIPGLRAALVPVTEDRFRNPEGELFFRSQDEFELHFLSPDLFELTSMEGETARYRRAQPYTPAAADMLDYVGRYQSDDLASAFEIETRPASVVVHRVGSNGQGTELHAISRDMYLLGRMTVRFIRDAAGNVVAFELSNPVIRNLRMPRVGEATGSS